MLIGLLAAGMGHAPPGQVSSAMFPGGHCLVVVFPADTNISHADESSARATTS